MDRTDWNSSVGALVRERPSRAKVFDRFGIDFCCGGKVSLASACEQQGVLLSSVIDAMVLDDAHVDADECLNVDSMTLTELCDHIEATHHRYLRVELPRLDQLTQKVAAVHGDAEPKLRTLRAIFEELQAELMPHMLKEEEVLFPYIRQLERGDSKAIFAGSATISPMQQLEEEHEHAGAALKQLRELSDNYTVPGWGCNTYRVMLDTLRELEANMHEHVHKENNVLFIKAAALETRRLADSTSAYI